LLKSVRRKRPLRVNLTEEDILEDYRLLGEAEEVAVVGFHNCRIRGGLFFNSGPGEIDVEEQEEDAEAYDCGLSFPVNKWFIVVMEVLTSN
jgi:hypothetical protein